MTKNLESPSLSVVSITYGDPGGLVRTLESLRQMFRDSQGHMEVIVQNGKDSPELRAIEASYKGWVSFEHESDGGIYDAMNKGLARTSGDYVWFLNGGDESSIETWGDIREMLTIEPGSVILGAYWLDLGKRRILRRSRPLSYMWHALPTSHQAILYPGTCARSIRYDTRYKVAGDYAFTATVAKECTAVMTNLPLAVFGVGGTSHTNARVIASEASRVQAEILGRGSLSRGVSRVLHIVSRFRRKLLADPVENQTD